MHAIYVTPTKKWVNQSLIIWTLRMIINNADYLVIKQ